MRFFGWIDHDAAHEQSVLSALGAAKGQDARDELGLGTIRDTLSDLLFPGTSTIQQRARYFLFVQWCCEMAARKHDDQAILKELRRLEVRLIARLSWLGEGAGVIGLQKQEETREPCSLRLQQNGSHDGLRHASRSPVGLNNRYVPAILSSAQ